MRGVGALLLWTALAGTAAVAQTLQELNAFLGQLNPKTQGGVCKIGALPVGQTSILNTDCGGHIVLQGDAQGSIYNLFIHSLPFSL